tara:strand:+ start:660 stop:1589 length:930 start_codon:yes stop_codon:yes gene_type:complete
MLDFINDFKEDSINEQLAKVDFPIDIMDIVDIPSTEYRQIRRTDTDTFMGMCKTRYKPITHSQAFSGALKAMETHIDFTDAQCTIESYEGGAMAMMEIMFPNHTAKVGNHDLNLKFIARNSYNGRWKYQSFFGWLNQVCFNTLVSGQQLAYSSNRHTTHFDIKQANAKIQSAVQCVTQDVERFNSWWNTRITDAQVVNLFKNTLAELKLGRARIVAGQSNVNQKCATILQILYDKEVTQIYGKGADYGRGGADGSLWCAYQAATEWSTHLADVDGKESTKRHIVESQRQDAVRKMLNSTHWKKLEPELA